MIVPFTIPGISMRPLICILLLCFSAIGCSTARLAKGTTVYRDVSYIEISSATEAVAQVAGHERQKLDLFVPPVADGKPLPLIVYFHGGGWNSGDRGNCPLTAFTQLGYAVASVDYRYSTDAIWPAPLYDCGAAVRYLAAHAGQYGIDPARIGVCGASAGGHLALMIALAPDHEALGEADECEGANPRVAVRCVASFFGPTDLKTLGGKRPDGPVEQLLGGFARDNPERAADASPIDYVGDHVGDHSSAAAIPPVLILHGDADPTVPIDQSRRLDAALKAAGARSTFIVVPSAGHGGGKFADPKLMDAVKAFFDANLKKA